MKFICIIVIIILIVLSGAINAQDNYYYGGGNIIPLIIDSSLVTIKFNDSIPVLLRDALIENIGRIEEIVFDDHVTDGFLACSLSTGFGYNTFLDSLDTLSGIDFVEPYYRTDNDSAFLVGIRFCAAFEEDMTEEEINIINDFYGVTL